MGTTFNEGNKPKNNITISRGTKESNHQISPDGEVNRSLAQPNPAINHPKFNKKSVTAQDKVESLNKNSLKGRNYDSK